MKTLSSSLTFFYKYIFSAIWSGGFGLGTLFMFLSPPEPFMPKYLFLLFWVVGTSFLYFTTVRIKKVQTDGRKILISNYLKSVEVDISDVLSVSGSVFLRPALVWFKLKQPTKMGGTVVFMPRGKLFSLNFTKHPMVKEIQALIDKQYKV